MKIKDAVKSGAGPRTIASELSGDLLDHTVPGTIPRNVAQISYYRNKQRKDNNRDKFEDILQYSLSNEGGKQCVRNLQFHSKGIRFVFAMPPQVEEIVSSCTSITAPCGILSIDTTFNIGKYYITPTSYPLKCLINRRTGKPVNVPGPCLFHVEEESVEVYLYFAHTLVEMNPAVDRVRFIGGDRGKGQRGFMHPFRESVLLPCLRHVQSNIKEHFSTEVCNIVFKDLFGSQKEMSKGLVDYSRDQLDDILQTMLQKWPQDFAAYFRAHLEADMKEGMLADVREAAGLGKEMFYNNVLECLNKKIKSKKREKQILDGNGAFIAKPLTLQEGVELYKSLVLEERCFIHKAIIGKGPYTLASGYENLYVSEPDFCQMTIEQKRLVLSKVDPFLKIPNIQPSIANGLLLSLTNNLG